MSAAAAATIHSDGIEQPLLSDEAHHTFWSRMSGKWRCLDRFSRTVYVLFAITIGAVISFRIMVELGNPFDYWPGPRITIPPKHDKGTDDEHRRNAVRAAMKHAWDGYRQHAFGMDELQPVTNRGSNKWGGWGVTLVDALDTLYIMELFEEFNEGVTHVTTMDFSKATAGYATPFFEMVIRVLAGLLTSYEMSLDRRLLEKAQQVGDVLFPVFNTTTGVPYPRVDVNTGEPLRADRVCIAEAGTVQLEYWKLSELTGNQKYHQAAQRVVDVLDKTAKPYKGLYPIWVDIQTGTVSSGHITFGGQGDSWYEYLLKQYIYSHQKNDQYRRMYEESIDAMKEKMVKTSIYDSEMAYVGDLDSAADKFNPKFQHLTCFVPGMLALGSKTLDRPDDLELAKKLAYTCYQMYNCTNTGLGPEYVLFRDSSNQGLSEIKDNNDFVIEDLAEPAAFEKEIGFYFGNDRSYILRPETLESLMILYRITGDEKYKEWGWSIFQAIEKWTKTPSAYSAYGDVQSTKGRVALTNSMESFFLAETLKYLYLLFSPADYYSLDEFVFNTEAHPFRLLRNPRP